MNNSTTQPEISPIVAVLILILAALLVFGVWYYMGLGTRMTVTSNPTATASNVPEVIVQPDPITPWSNSNLQPHHNP